MTFSPDSHSVITGLDSGSVDAISIASESQTSIKLRTRMQDNVVAWGAHAGSFLPGR